MKTIMDLVECEMNTNFDTIEKILKMDNYEERNLALQIACAGFCIQAKRYAYSKDPDCILWAMQCIAQATRAQYVKYDKNILISAEFAEKSLRVANSYYLINGNK